MVAKSHSHCRNMSWTFAYVLFSYCFVVVVQDFCLLLLRLAVREARASFMWGKQSAQPLFWVVRVKFSILLEHRTQASRSALDSHRHISGGLSVSPHNRIEVDVTVLRKWEDLSLQTWTCSLPFLLCCTCLYVRILYAVHSLSTGCFLWAVSSFQPYCSSGSFLVSPPHLSLPCVMCFSSLNILMGVHKMSPS